jgi:hypothetical protein
MSISPRLPSTTPPYLGVEKRRLNENAGDTVRVDVGCRATVLKVSIALGADVAGNTDRGTTVRDTSRELGDRGSLVTPGQALIIVLSIAT